MTRMVPVLVGALAMLAIGSMPAVAVPSATPTSSPVPTATATPDALATARAQARAIPNDRGTFLGDRIVFNHDVIGYIRQDGVVKAVCIPAETYLRGIGQNTEGGQLFTTDCKWFGDGGQLDFFPPTRTCSVKGFFPCDSYPEAAASVARVDAGKEITTETIELDSIAATGGTPPSRYGVTFGGLVVPFKLQLSGNTPFQASASAAPYLGYRFGFQAYGLEVAPVAFAGVGIVSATTTTTDAQGKTSSDTNELASFSYGVGIIGVAKQIFQFGVVLGFDHVGTGKNYEFNDNPWLALELGAEIK